MRERAGFCFSPFALQSAYMEPLFVILAVVAVFAFVLGRLADRRSGGVPRTVTAPSRSASSDPLVMACGGDRAKADRLAAYELRKAPDISQDEARRRALDRLSRDRGR